MTGQLMEIRRTVWGPRVPTLKGTEVSLSYVQCIFFTKCLYFSHCMAGYFLDRPQGCIEGYQICSFSLQIQEKKICYFLHDFCPLWINVWMNEWHDFMCHLKWFLHNYLGNNHPPSSFFFLCVMMMLYYIHVGFYMFRSRYEKKENLG